MKILHTTNNEKVTEFLKKNNANAERVELTGATLWSVAVEEGKVIGVAGANIGKYADRIKGFFVIKEYRRKGIGTELLQDILGHTKPHVLCIRHKGEGRGCKRKNTRGN